MATIWLLFIPTSGHTAANQVQQLLLLLFNAENAQRSMKCETAIHHHRRRANF